MNRSRKRIPQRHKTFETWYFEVASASERQLPAEEQEYAYEMWLTQELTWAATIDDLEEYDDYGNPPDSSEMH